jgi:preprotein translocase subunit SecY
MIQALKNAFALPDLRRRILFTLVILVLYRLASHVPIPNVDPVALRQLFQGGTDAGQLLSFLDLLSGGAMSRFSIMAMGVYPYITASIILQLLMPIIPQLEELAKEGEAGQQKMNQYTHWLTVPLATLQAYTQVAVIAGQAGVVRNFGLPDYPLETIATLVTMTAGTIFAVWLGELITEGGIGNGVSIIIFGGIVTQIPTRVRQFVVAQEWLALGFFGLLTVITVAVIVFVYEGQRRIPVQYGKRVRGMRVYGGQSTHIPLRVNSAGMIPLIFAQSIMIFPSTIASYFRGPSMPPIVVTIADSIYRAFNPNGNPYWILYFFMVIGFTYFYTDVIFRQQNLAENLQKQGGFIPGLRPGKRTENYLNGVLQRITLVGALFLGMVAILPWLAPLLVQDFTGTKTLIITSTGLLIVVGVVLDTIKQLEAQLLMRHYEGFIR